MRYTYTNTLLVIFIVIGQPVSLHLLQGQLHTSIVTNSSAHLSTEVERDKTGVTVSNTSTSNDIVNSITSPTTPTTTTASNSYIPRYQKTFEVGDIILYQGS